MKRSSRLFSCSHAFVYVHILFKFTLISTALLSGIRFWVLVWMIGTPVLNHIWQCKILSIYNTYIVSLHTMLVHCEKLGSKKCKTFFIVVPVVFNKICKACEFLATWDRGLRTEVTSINFLFIPTSLHHHIIMCCYCLCHGAIVGIVCYLFCYVNMYKVQFWSVKLILMCQS